MMIRDLQVPAAADVPERLWKWLQCVAVAAVVAVVAVVAAVCWCRK